MDGIEVVGYSAAVTAAVNGAVWIGKRFVLNQGKAADREAELDAWFRKSLDTAKDELRAEREDCTERIETMRNRLDASDERFEATERRLEECRQQHNDTLEQRAADIEARHKQGAELRDLRARYEEIRGIVDVITELPDSQPPAASPILGATK